MAAPSATNGPQTMSIASSMCGQDVLKAPTCCNFPEHCVVSFQPDMKCVLQGNNSLKAFKISMALVLIGTNPKPMFLKGQGQYLGIDPTKPISCKQNPIDIHPYSFECAKEPGLFAMGPLVGDNFVRFLKGGALGIASCLIERLKKKEKIIDISASDDPEQPLGIRHPDLPREHSVSRVLHVSYECRYVKMLSQKEDTVNLAIP
ncbi:hypothetical protein CRUP_034910 [Coryphaenoides rupestris]|nr:hypothetical protein CRUP_034910 [Coryphaenoides rupestris]